MRAMWAAFLFWLAGALLPAGAVEYNYNVSVGGITGNIVTSCDNGCALDSSNIIADSFTSTDLFTGEKETLTNPVLSVIYGTSVLFATNTGIFFDVPNNNHTSMRFGNQIGDPLAPDLVLEYCTVCGPPLITVIDGNTWGGAAFFSTPYQIASFTTDPSTLPAATPLPSTLSLFVGGLAALAVFGLRKKRTQKKETFSSREVLRLRG